MSLLNWHNSNNPFAIWKHVHVRRSVEIQLIIMKQTCAGIYVTSVNTYIYVHGSFHQVGARFVMVSIDCKSRAYSNIGTRQSARVCFLYALKQCAWDQSGPKNVWMHTRLARSIVTSVNVPSIILDYKCNIQLFSKLEWNQSLHLQYMES